MDAITFPYPNLNLSVNRAPWLAFSCVLYCLCWILLTPFRAASLTHPREANQPKNVKLTATCWLSDTRGVTMVYVTTVLVCWSMEECGNISTELLFQNQTYHIPRDLFSTSVRRVCFEVFFDLRLNKRLGKQPWGWWFETPSWSLWRHCHVWLWCTTRSESYDSPLAKRYVIGILPCKSSIICVDDSNNISIVLGDSLTTSLTKQVYSPVNFSQNLSNWTKKSQHQI